MKAISRIVCCAVALVWMLGATAEEAAVDQGAAGEDRVTEAPAPAGDPSGDAAGDSATASPAMSAAPAPAAEADESGNPAQ